MPKQYHPPDQSRTDESLQCRHPYQCRGISDAFVASTLNSIRLFHPVTSIILSEYCEDGYLSISADLGMSSH